MMLKSWLRKKGYTHRQFAKMVGRTQQAVSRWVAGERTPDAQQIVEIQRITRGKVKLEDWIRTRA